MKNASASGSSKSQMLPSLLLLPASFFKVLPLPQKFNCFHFHKNLTASSFLIPTPCFMKNASVSGSSKKSKASELASASSFFLQSASASTKI